MPVTVDTLIFLDVDGVLNVGVQDGLNDPIAFTSGNLQLAHQMAASAKTGNSHPVAERILAVAARKLAHGENGIYEKLVAQGDDLSDLLVSRFVKLVQAAGSRCHLVFSSSWRRPKHAKRKQRLESCIAKHMGKPFTFDASTSLREERTPIDRLQVIGEYLVDFCRLRGGDVPPALRVMVLEDFCGTALCGQSCQGVSIHSPEAAEHYLATLVGNDFDVKVKLLHTYDSWTTEQGTPMAVGCGLTMEHFVAGLSFLTELDLGGEYFVHNEITKSLHADHFDVTEKSYQKYARLNSLEDSLLDACKNVDGASNDFSFTRVMARFLACMRGACSPCQCQAQHS
jgi:hypothetical protein